MLGTAQVLPGPNVCNLSLMIGDKFFGWRGALVALLGMIAAPFAVLLVLAWALGQTTDLGRVREIMLTPIAGEITEREPSNGYLIFQGGIPEVEEFISKIKK